MMIASPTLLVLGLILLLFAFLMLNWASNRNLKDVAIGAGVGALWTLLWKRQRPGVPEEFTSRANEVRAERSHLGKAKVVTGYAVKHVIAMAVGWVGVVVFLLGALSVALGVFWR